MWLSQAGVFAAEDFPPLPSTREDASVFGQKVTDELTAKSLRTSSAEVPKPEPTQKPPRAESDVTFLLHKAKIHGNSNMPVSNFADILARYEGRQITIGEAHQMAQEIEDVYLRRGYLTTQALIPPQQISDGMLLIHIYEGVMGRLHIEGNKWFSEKRLRAYWTLERGQVLDHGAMRSAVRRMDEHPDRSIQAVLKPGEKPSETDVYLKVEDRFPGHIGAQYDNKGSRASGRRRAGVNVKYNDWLLPDASFVVGGLAGKDSEAFFTQYWVPLNPTGTKLVLSHTKSRVDPKREFDEFDVVGRSTLYSVTLRKELIDNEKKLITGYFGLDFKNSRSEDISGLRRKDHLRVLRPGLDMTFTNPQSRTSVNQEFSIGIDSWGSFGEANPFSGRPGADPSFYKWSGDITHEMYLPPEGRLQLKFQHQISHTKLFSQEQFFLGGADSVRGYPESDFLGDQGVFMSVEYLRPLPFVPESWRLPFSERTMREDIQLATFFDQGFAYLNEARINELDHRYMAGVGGGIRLRFSQYLYARLDLAHAFGDEPLSESPHNRFHFYIQGEY